MKCFKIFFKRTWHPQQMETPSKFDAARTVGVGYKVDETELGEVKITATTPSVATSDSIEVSGGSVPCGSGGCRSSRSRRSPRPENPWHRLKTIFLVSMIVALIVWVVVYTLLSQYEIL